jgi:hypothetical protein
MNAPEINHGGRAHALLSASGAYRWLNCTPSARLEDAEGETGESEYAKEGTWAHELSEIELRYALNRMTLDEYIVKRNEYLGSDFATADNVEAVESYVDYVIGEWREAKKADDLAEIHIEDRVDLTDYIPEGYGTNDVVIISGKTLRVIDLKFGRGVRVSAQDNPQLKLYGLGAMEKHGILFDINEIVLVIHQPRISAEPSEHFILDHALLAWAEKVVRPKAALAFEGKGEFVPGKHCHFCKVAHRCRALAEENLKLATHDFAEPALLEDSDLVDIYERADMFLKWIGKVTDFVKAEAIAGKKWPGLKLVEGRSVRQIANEDAVVTALEDAGFTPDRFTNVKLKGLTDLTKILGKADFEAIVAPYVVKPPGKPTLVTVDDPRPEFDSNHKNDFKDEETTP